MEIIGAALSNGFNMRAGTAAIGRAAVVIRQDGDLLHRFNTRRDDRRAAPLQTVRSR